VKHTGRYLEIVNMQPHIVTVNSMQQSIVENLQKCGKFMNGMINGCKNCFCGEKFMDLHLFLGNLCAGWYGCSVRKGGPI